MRSIAALAGVLLFLVSASPSFGQPTDSNTLEIVNQSRQALDQNDAKKAKSLVEEGLTRFPNDEALQLQLARVYVYEKHDGQAIGLLNAVLRNNPSSRDARLQLAQIFGYRKNYRASDRLYRELLTDNPDDETASAGLVHNLILEGKKQEARQQVKDALQRHPASLLLQQYSDYLAASPKTETRVQSFHRLQSSEYFFADSSGNRSFYSAQSFGCQVSPRFNTHSWLEETTLWRPGLLKQTVLSASGDFRLKLNQFVTFRAGGGGVRFADGNTHPLYATDVDLFPWKNLLVSTGYVRSFVAPTADAALLDLLSQTWRTRVDYHTRNFSASGNFGLSHYSDGNHAEREYAEVLRWFGSNRFSIGGGYAFRHLHFDKDLNHGYFSPTQYRSHLAAAGVRFHIGKIFRAEYLGYGGGEILSGVSGYTPAGEVLLKNDFVLGKWDLGADYSHFHLLQTTGAFRADSATLTVGYRF